MKLKIVETRTREELEKIFERFTKKKDLFVIYGAVKFQRNIYYSHDGKDFTKNLKESWIAFIPYNEGSL